MIAPITFVKADGTRKCIDAYDVCSIDEAPGDGHVEITWACPHKTHSFTTSQSFQDIVDACVEACKAADPSTSEGEEWKDG